MGLVQPLMKIRHEQGLCSWHIFTKNVSIYIKKAKKNSDNCNLNRRIYFAAI